MKKFDPIQMEMLRGFNIFLLIFSLFFAICMLLGSCKSIKTEIVYEYRDSIITHVVTDTVRVTVSDTIHIEQSSESSKESSTELQFGDGGGTYNTQTGEATNLQSVKVASREKDLQTQVLTYKHIADSLAVENDSLTQSLHEAQGEEHTQQNTAEITPRNGWDRFCTWWFIGSCIVLLLLLAYGCWKLYRHFNPF